jgi:hypothetical protein
MSAMQVREILEDAHPNRVFTVEEGIVWVSGMNSQCTFVAESMAQTLVEHDIPAGLVHDDGVHAMNNSGVQFRYGENA